MAGIMALPLAPLTIAAGPELYSLGLLYPEAVIAGAGLTRGFFMTPSPADEWVTAGFFFKQAYRYYGN
jgi:hypothetical protein